MPATIDVDTLLRLLDLLPVRHHGVAGRRVDVAEHVRMTAHELVVDAPRHVGHVERARLVGEHRVEDHLVEQVTELVDERDVRRIVGRDVVGRLRAAAARRPRRPRSSPRAGTA